MPSGGRTPWTDPGTLTGIAGLLMIAFGSYKDFQADSVDRIAGIDKRVAVLESQIADLKGER